jgi:Golgin subfamily A member 5
MSFLSKALRRAEDFLEQVDESVAQASRRMVVEGVAGEYDDHAWVPSADDPLGAETLTAGEIPDESFTRHSGPLPPLRRGRGVANIPKASSRVELPALETPGHGGEVSPHGQAELAKATAESPPRARTDISNDGGAAEGWSTELDMPDALMDAESARSNTSGLLSEQFPNARGEETVQTGHERERSPRDKGTARYQDDGATGKIADAVSAAVVSSAKVESSREMDGADKTKPKWSPEFQQVPGKPAGPVKSEASGIDVHGDLKTSQANDLAAIMQENEELRKELHLAEEDFDSLIAEREKHILNVQRLKSVVADMDDTLKEKSADVRRLQLECSAAKDAKDALQKQLRAAEAKSRDTVERMNADLGANISLLEAESRKASEQAEAIQTENARLKDALTQGREVDMATADGARIEASHAHDAYEREMTAHLETRNALKEMQESMESQAAITADALAMAQRKADEAAAFASSAKAAQRSAEGNLARVKSARDAALARIQDLEQALAQYEGTNGLPPGREELASMQQTVSELENALEAKNVELTRLEGEVENMRGALKARNDNLSSPRNGSPGVSDEYTHSHEVEQKLRHMADSALRKQGQIEALRSENRALQHQLETERKRTREAQAMAAAASSSRNTLRGGIRGIVDMSDEERGERPYGVREGPIARFRTPRSWPRTVSRFVFTLDKVSAEILSFLRKEPLLRMVIIIYLCALHLFIYCLLHYHVETTMGPGAEHGLHVAVNAPQGIGHMGAKLEHIGAVVGHR